MTYRILAFCGGGIRGLLSAIMLQRLQAATGVNLAAQADLIVGTSTGSWITALLTANLTPEEIVLFYDPGMATMMALDGQKSPDAPAFGSGLLAKLFSKIPLQIPGVLGQPLSALDRNIMVASFEIGSEEHPWSTQLIHNFPGSSTASMSLLDAVHCSGAMPGMLAPADVTLGGQPKRFVDGAFMHHDPTVAAIALAVANKGLALSDISVLDFGTGFMANYISADADVANWGSSQWLSPQNAGRLPALLVNTPNPGQPIFNMMLNGTSTNLIPDLATLMLGERFAYLNPDFGSTYIAEDAVDQASLKFLRETAECYKLDSAEAVVRSYWAA